MLPRNLSKGKKEFLEVPSLPRRLHRLSLFQRPLAFVGRACGLLSESERQGRQGN